VIKIGDIMKKSRHRKKPMRTYLYPINRSIADTYIDEITLKSDQKPKRSGEDKWYSFQCYKEGGLIGLVAGAIGGIMDAVKDNNNPEMSQYTLITGPLVEAAFSTFFSSAIGMFAFLKNYDQHPEKDKAPRLHYKIIVAPRTIITANIGERMGYYTAYAGISLLTKILHH